MSTNVVAAVRAECAKAIKAKDNTVQPPSKWATQAGFAGSAASPLRKFLGRDSGNGVGRTGRYPPVDAEGLLDLLDEAERYRVAEDTKKAPIAKRIHTKLHPAAKAGAKSAKTQSSTSKTKATKAAA
jgi:hypothetical protein